MEELAYMKEATGNQPNALREIDEIGQVKLCCIYCLKMWETTNLRKVPVISQMTMCCPHCNVDALIPVIPSSVLYGKTEEEQLRQLEEWRYDGFNIPPKKEEISCMGCHQGLANQEAHMDIGGCLYTDYND